MSNKLTIEIAGKIAATNQCGSTIGVRCSDCPFCISYNKNKMDCMHWTQSRMSKREMAEQYIDNLLA